MSEKNRNTLNAARVHEQVFGGFTGGLCASCPVETGQCPRCGSVWWIDAETGKRRGYRVTYL